MQIFTQTTRKLDDLLTGGFLRVLTDSVSPIKKLSQKLVSTPKVVPSHRLANIPTNPELHLTHLRWKCDLRLTLSCMS